MDMLWICVTTFLASGLTLFSGFGLGTILMPVVALTLPVPVAIAVTAVVHFMNKLFKLLLLWRHVNGPAMVGFGIPALLAAIPGAMLLGYLSGLKPLGTYMLMEHEHTLLPVKIIAGALLIFFAFAEQVPVLGHQAFRRLGLPVGGALSGFFGGLTGHQGAFRSAFLVQGGLSEKSFVATNAAIAAFVDATRLLIYGMTFDFALIRPQTPLVLAAIAASFVGVMLGAAFLEKVTIGFIRMLVALMMYAFGAGLVAGLI